MYFLVGFTLDAKNVPMFTEISGLCDTIQNAMDIAKSVMSHYYEQYHIVYFDGTTYYNVVEKGERVLDDMGVSYVLWGDDIKGSILIE